MNQAIKHLAHTAMTTKWYRVDMKHPDEYAHIIDATSYLPPSATPLQRCYHVVHDLAAIPVCPECQAADRKWEPTTKRYAATCGSKQCVTSVRLASKQQTLDSQSPDDQSAAQHRANEKRRKTIAAKWDSVDQFYSHVTSKRQQTMVDRYGQANSAQVPEIRSKQVQTIVERYGVENVAALPETQEKIKRTNVERYGTEWHQLTDVGKQTRAQTNTERYGTASPLASPVVRATLISNHTNKHGVAYPSQRPDVKDKITASVRARYGVDNYAQRHFTAETLAKLEDGEWLRDQHSVQQKTLVEIAADIGVDPKTVGTWMKKHSIEVQRFLHSTGEHEVVEFLTGIGVSVITGTRQLIPPYEIDIYLPEHNIAIEYCGLYWHSDIHPRIGPTYHSTKTDMCDEQGIQLITLFEDEWVNQTDIVKDKLLDIIGMSTAPAIGARKCIVVRDPSLVDVRQLLEANHIQGYGGGSIKYALEHDGKLVAALVVKNHQNGTYEISRYATTGRVVGGFTRLLQAFMRDYQPRQVYTYADRRWSTGRLYEKTGFTRVRNTRPSYWYLSPRADHRLHRSHFRHANLAAALGEYDPSLTEFENCDRNGVLRVWDCGLIRYEIHR